MTLILVTRPTGEPVALSAVKDHLAIGQDETEFDNLLTGYIAAVRGYLDGRDGILSRALLPQTWDLKRPCFPAEALELPLPPLQSVTSVSYVDANGDAQTLSPSAYLAFGIGGTEPGGIAPAYGQSWPATRDVLEAVIVRFTAGYADSSVPPPIIQAILETIADLFANRESVAPDQFYPVPMPANADSLLAPYRTRWLA